MKTLHKAVSTFAFVTGLFCVSEKFFIEYPLSHEQIVIPQLIFTGKSVACSACAGSGKTHTASFVVKNYAGKVHDIPFSKKMADEAKLRYAAHPNVTSGTFHSRGLKLCRNVRKVEAKKCLNIAKILDAKFAPLIADFALALKNEAFGIWDKALTVAQVAKKYNFNTDLIDKAVQCLRLSDLDRENVDFADMLRFPVLQETKAILEGLIVLDEAQDYTPNSFIFLTSCLTLPTSHVLMIGDYTRQCLMIFAGANPELFNVMAKHFNCENVNITENRRCARKIVECAEFKGDMVALPNAIEGEVGEADMTEFLEEVYDGQHVNDAILCAANAPLIGIGLTLLNKGIDCRMRTARLEAMILPYLYKYLNTKSYPVGTIADKIEKDRQDSATLEECEEDAGKNDVINCIRLLETYCLVNGIKDTSWKPVPRHPIQQALGKLVGGNKGVSLLTIHTSKGLEFHATYEIMTNGREITTENERMQYEAVRHVATTRAKEKRMTLVD